MNVEISRNSWPQIHYIPESWISCTFPEYETMFIFGRYDKDNPLPAIYLDFESNLNCTVENTLTGMLLLGF